MSWNPSMQPHHTTQHDYPTMGTARASAVGELLGQPVADSKHGGGEAAGQVPVAAGRLRRHPSPPSTSLDPLVAVNQPVYALDFTAFRTRK